MANQPEKPDFIVDPAGNARDVRREKYSQWNEPSLRTIQPETQSKPAQSYVPQSSGINPAFPIFFIISLILFVIRLSMSASVARNTSSQPVGGLFFEDGNNSYDLGNYEDAIKQFTTAINLSPEFGEAYNNRGLAYCGMGDYDKALADFGQAIQLLPSSAMPYSNRGATYLAMGDHTNALADLEKAIQLNPRFGKAHYIRGLAYLEMENYDNAIADFGKAIEFTPEQFTAMLNKMPTSESSFTRQVTNRLEFVQSYADLPSAYTYRGIAYLNNKDYLKAFADFNKAIELQPDLALAYYYRGIAYSFYDERDKGIADFEKVLELNNNLLMQQEAETRLNEMEVTSTTSIEASGLNTTPATAMPSDFLDVKGVVMRNVPAGTLLMGSDNDNPEERPAHSVYLDAYAIDEYEVTNRFYKACVDAGVCLPPVLVSSSTRPNYYGNQEFDDYPVVNVDWNMAKTHCEWRGARLPTEAEWEKAARGMDGQIYPWGNYAPNKDLLNYNQEVGDTTMAGSYEMGKSFYGIYDMAGNVWEWVNDWYDEAYYQTLPSTDPLGPSAGHYRVLRGGSWSDDANGVRSSRRFGLDPTGAFNVGGFRCARSLP